MLIFMVLLFRTNGEQIRAQLALNASTEGNDTSFSYSDAPLPKGYLDTTTSVYIYMGKKTWP